VVHGADKAASATLLLLPAASAAKTTLALEVARAVAGLVRVGSAKATAAIRGCLLIARIFAATVPVAITELLLPALGAARGLSILCLAVRLLPTLRLLTVRLKAATLTIAVVAWILSWSGRGLPFVASLNAGDLALCRGVSTGSGSARPITFALPLAAAAAAALGLPHSVRNALSVFVYLVPTGSAVILFPCCLRNLLLLRRL
jgi:hypothetical protein